MTTNEITKQVISFLKEELHLGKEMEIDENTGLMEIGLDSISLAVLIVLVEEHYGFQAGEDELTQERFGKLGDIEEYICSKINNK